MFPRIKQVRYVDEYRLLLFFRNGEQGEIDLRERIVGRGGIFHELENLEYFKQVEVDPEVGTIVWPNGVDLDPDVLYSSTMGVPLPQFKAVA